MIIDRRLDRIFRPHRRHAIAAGLLGSVLLLGSMWLVASANAGDATITKGSRHRWTSPQAIYLVNTGEHLTTCTVSPDHGASRDVLVHTRTPGARVDAMLALHGTRLDRWFRGDATVTCDYETAVSTGWLLWWYRTYPGPIVPVAGVVLMCAAITVLRWWHSRATPVGVVLEAAGILHRPPDDGSSDAAARRGRPGPDARRRPGPDAGNDAGTGTYPGGRLRPATPPRRQDH